MNAKMELIKIKNEGLFTKTENFEEFIDGLCKRYARIYGEILPHKNYKYIYNKLVEKEII